MESLPGTSTMKLPDQPFSQLRRSFPHLSDEGLDLLRGLLTYDPTKRTTARQALRHAWFEVRCCNPADQLGGYESNDQLDLFLYRCSVVMCLSVRNLIEHVIGLPPSIQRERSHA